MKVMFVGRARTTLTLSSLKNVQEMWAHLASFVFFREKNRRSSISVSFLFKLQWNRYWKIDDFFGKKSIHNHLPHKQKYKMCIYLRA